MTTEPLAGFPPIVAPHARVLVLGTMPGAASLAAAEYYAHPRNAFWGIMAALVGVAPERPYRERTQAVAAAGIAVWDVLGACRRAGSLDTAIEPDTMVVNDFAAFFAGHPSITHVFFNGAKAAELFRRRVADGAVPAAVVERRRLPSTSPTNARLRFVDKLAAWRVVGEAASSECHPCPPPSRCSPSTSSARSSTGAAR